MLHNAGNVENASFVNLFPIGVDENTLCCSTEYADNVENASYVNLFPIDVGVTILCCSTLAMLKKGFICQSISDRC